MKLIIECDGPILDVQPIYWSAYSTAVGEIGLARTDPADFWRLVRTGAAGGQAIRGAKPRQFQEYEIRFSALIDSDECCAKCSAREGVAKTLTRLTKHGACALITASANRESRQQALDSDRLSVHFTQMCKLFSQESRRAEQIRELVGDDPRVVVAASTVAVVRAGCAADFLVVGVSNGSCTGRRLTQAGAQLTFDDLEELADELDGGSQRLRDCGLLPPSLEHQGPVFETPQHERRSSRDRGGRGRYGSR